MTDADADLVADHVAPIRRRIVVPTDPADAFRLWTDDLGAWWPLAGHSVHGAASSVGFHGGRLVERGPDGDEVPWGEVLDWEPPHRLRLTWHPGRGAEEATEVEVRFEAVPSADADGPHTLVTLEHRGWATRADAAEARREYHEGWATVLGRFGAAGRGRAAGGADLPDAPAATAAPTGGEPADDRSIDEVWLALVHTAGPAAPTDGPLFAHPDFGEHPAFLGRLAEQATIVAAGPLGPLDGPPTGARGMTVVRVPADRVDAVAALARTDDRAVVRGLLEVEVLRWSVVPRA